MKEGQIDGAPAVPVHELLQIAKSRAASDLYLTVGVPPMLRIDGELHPIGKDMLMPPDTERLVSGLFHEEGKLEQFRRNGDMDFSISLAGIGRFRVNTFMQRGSWAAAIRMVHTELPDPAVLGIPGSVLDLHRINRGLVLVTGPTGSGKSTTLSCLIDLINRTRRSHILTIEEPIEFLHRHRRSIVNQREIGQDTVDYSRALRSALRESPDVILLGELRDFETISVAMTAAETGHLVLSTLHTVGSAKTIDRVIDVFPPNQQQQIRVQLSTILQAVVSQQLIPSGNRGRAAAFEIMIVNNAIRNMIRENKTHQIDGAIQMGRSQGMISMDAALAELARHGRISREDAMTYCMNPEVLSRLLG